MKASSNSSTITNKTSSRKTKSEGMAINETLQPIESVYLGGDYSSSHPVEIYKRGDTALIKIPDTTSFGASLIDMGAISDLAKQYKPESIQKAVQGFINPEHRATHLHLLHLSPFWIGALSRLEKILGHERGKFRNILILYRLVEICLEAIQALENDGEEKTSQLQTSASLLLRQRYIYLAQLNPLAIQEREKLPSFVPGYEFQIRKAREAYASLLLDEDRVLLAFSEVENGGKPWDLDGEVQLLLYGFSRIEGMTQQEAIQLISSSNLWSFAKSDLPDMILTDTLLRRWFLAHDDLASASAAVRGLLDSDKKILKLAAGGLNRVYLLSGIGLAFFFAGAYLPEGWQIIPELALGWLKQALIYIGAFIGLILPFLSVITIVFLSQKPFSGRQVLYPLALRVPAMGLVGVLAIAGLADSLVRYTLNAFQWIWPALFVVICSIVAAFAYILFEVQTRIPVRQKAWRRASALWLRGVISTTWLAIVTGWLVDPIGITACTPEMETKIKCITNHFGSVISIERSANFLGGRISLDYIFLVGALALLVGVFTQIFWEDKAIAEPL